MRLSITERYGVMTPGAALEAALRRHCPDKAQQILDEYRRAQRRYGRAVKLEEARRRVRDAAAHGEPAPGSLRAGAVQRARALLERADEFLDEDNYEESRQD